MKYFYTILTTCLFCSHLCKSQDTGPQTKGFYINAGIQYSMPCGDIKLVRGTRKTVTHEILPAAGFRADLNYQFKNGRYFFASAEVTSFQYNSAEYFFIGQEYKSSDQMLNIAIHGGLGWEFPRSHKDRFFFQPSLVYVIHNSELSDFYSERILPDDLSTVNITEIDWDLFNSIGIGAGLGYRFQLSGRFFLEIYDSLILTVIEGDIVDSPTSNDFDNEPNMSRGFMINNLGMNIRFRI